MFVVEIPGFGQLELIYLVLAYNGTLAQDSEAHIGGGEPPGPTGRPPRLARAPR
jgi:hypothetical protein